MTQEKNVVSAVLAGQFFDKYGRLMTAPLVERFILCPELLKYAVQSIEKIPVERLSLGHEYDLILKILQKARKSTVQDLAGMTEEQILKLSGMNRGYLSAIKIALSFYGFFLSIAPSDHDARPIEDLNLSIRARKALRRLRISTIGELRRVPKKLLLETKNFGSATYRELLQKLERFGLTLREY